ncbi:hypothetical protein M0804_009470 [Polistes exclamans]|nr:hypothetical protein M0804_009470 [Polistes exclamans]
MLKLYKKKNTNVAEGAPLFHRIREAKDRRLAKGGIGGLWCLAMVVIVIVVVVMVVVLVVVVVVVYCYWR